MKKLLKYLGIVALAAGFTACEHPDISEVFDKGAQAFEGNIAYMRAPMTTDYKLQYRASSEENGYTIISSFEEEMSLSNVQITRASEGSVVVTIDYDNEALDALNAQLAEEQGEDAKQYKIFDKSDVNSKTFTFTDGETSLPLSLKFDTNELFGSEVNKYYALPLRIVSVSENGSAISSNMGGFIMKFDVEYVENAISFSTGTQSYNLSIYEDGKGAHNGMEEWNLSAYLRSTYGMAGNTTVKLRINNSLIASSNYPDDIAVPTVKLSQDTYTFEADKTANEQIKLLFSDGMNSLKADTNYQIPIEIETVSGHGATKGAVTVLTCRITTVTYTPKYLTFTNHEDVYEISYDKDSKDLLGGASQVTMNSTVQATLPLDYYAYVYYTADKSLVDKYNEENGTDYVYPSTATAYSSYMYIPSGSTVASSSYNVKINFSDQMKTLSPDQTYLVPIVFSRVTCNDPEVVMTDDVFYAVFKSRFIEVPTSVSSTNNIPGTPIARDNIKAWYINTNTPDTKGTDQSDNVNGLGSSTLVSLNSTSNSLLIDLGGVHNFSGFVFHAYMSTYSIKQLGLQTSTDGNNWEVWDDSFSSVQAATQYFTVKNPKSVRYIRFIPKAAFSGTYVYMSARAGGIEFYEQK